MNRQTKKLRKMLISFGKQAIETYQRQNRPLGQFIDGKLHFDGIPFDMLKLKDGRFHKDGRPLELFSISVKGGRPHIDRDNSVWKSLKQTDEYRKIKALIANRYEIQETWLEELLKEYIYELVADKFSRNFPEDPKHIDTELSIRADVLVKDFEKESPSFSALCPLFLIKTDSLRIDLGQYGTIRRAFYSEKLTYTPKYPELVAPYGPNRLDYILELERICENIVVPPKHPADYMDLAGNIIISLRLLYTGGVGMEYFVVWSHPKQEPIKIGNMEMIGNTTFKGTRALRPGAKNTMMTSSSADALITLISLLESLDKTSFLFRALTRYGTAVESISPADKIIDSIIALECLFGGSKKQAAPRIAKLISNDSSERDNIELFLGRCWSARAKLVHGMSYENAEQAAGEELDKVAELLVEYVRKCLLKGIIFHPENPKKLQEIVDSL